MAANMFLEYTYYVGVLIRDTLLIIAKRDLDRCAKLSNKGFTQLQNERLKVIVLNVRKHPHIIKGNIKT